jgi:tripartite-type tricarboxylate transporter receptor subunit TctC
MVQSRGWQMRNVMQMKLLVALAAAILSFNSQANAQKFPDRPMTMVIPFAAGGPTDVLGRVVAGRMSEVLGQQVVE